MEIVAHRGASAEAPEHTWAAYDLAIEQGADTLEIDVRMTADRRLVALHDPTLARTAGDPRAVAGLALSELGTVPRRQRPLRLSRILRRYRGEARFLIDLKDTDPPLERRLLATLDAERVRDRVVVQSFDDRSLRRLHALAPDVPIALLREKLPLRRTAWLDRVVAMGAEGIGVREVDAELIAAATARRLRVRAWTVNSPLEARRLAALGVDGIITDAPGRICRALGEELLDSVGTTAAV